MILKDNPTDARNPLDHDGREGIFYSANRNYHSKINGSIIIIIPNRANKAPVSYTHLDVYKRQVYGMLIASYMKEYRMKLTSNMLLQEDKSISEIAAAVGYKSQSKFTSAFRDIFQILPTAYQKLYRNR